LVRIFSRMTEETLEQFLRRMRLERAAYMLLTTKNSILEIAFESGYQSAEAFARSFRRAFGLVPTEFRRNGIDWKLESPVGLHWNADWVLIDSNNRTWEETPIVMPIHHACVWRFVGNYGWLEHGWARFAERFTEDIPADATFITSYLDNMWTHPVRDTMRAELGWICDGEATPPKGMRKILIPSGTFVASRFVARSERNDAWSYIGGRYGRPDNDRKEKFAIDIYNRLPVPFAEARTQILVGCWDCVNHPEIHQTQ
jgi:AraC-like DNA-binding protein